MCLWAYSMYTYSILQFNKLIWSPRSTTLFYYAGSTSTGFQNMHFNYIFQRFYITVLLQRLLFYNLLTTSNKILKYYWLRKICWRNNHYLTVALTVTVSIPTSTFVISRNLRILVFIIIFLTYKQTSLLLLTFLRSYKNIHI